MTPRVCVCVCVQAWDELQRRNELQSAQVCRRWMLCWRTLTRARCAADHREARGYAASVADHWQEEEEAEREEEAQGQKEREEEEKVKPMSQMRHVSRCGNWAVKSRALGADGRGVYGCLFGYSRVSFC